MTPAERRAALNERIKTMVRSGTCINHIVDVALEEAARVAEGYHRTVETRRDLFDDGNITVTKGHPLVDPRKIAAAIRDLIPE